MLIWRCWLKQWHLNGHLKRSLKLPLLCNSVEWEPLKHSTFPRRLGNVGSLRRSVALSHSNISPLTWGSDGTGSNHVMNSFPRGLRPYVKHMTYRLDMACRNSSCVPDEDWALTVLSPVLKWQSYALGEAGLLKGWHWESLIILWTALSAASFLRKCYFTKWLSATELQKWHYWEGSPPGNEAFLVSLSSALNCLALLSLVEAALLKVAHMKIWSGFPR